MVCTQLTVVPVVNAATTNFASRDQVLLAQNFDQFNPLSLGANPDITSADKVKNPRQIPLSTPAGILSEVLKYGIPIAGLLLFVMLVWGGFEILSSAASSGKKDAGKQRITAAVIGFILLFASYWIVQLIQVVFGVNILG